MKTTMIERTCIDSRCHYGQHHQVRGHKWAEEEHTCDPWPDWAQCDLRHLATEALYRYAGHWAGAATIAALKDLVDTMPDSAPGEVIAEFLARGKNS